MNWLRLLTLIHDGLPDPERAKIIFKCGCELNEKHGHKCGVALGTFHLGITEDFRHNDDAALSLFSQSLPIFEEYGDLILIARVSEFLGRMYVKQGNHEKALRYFEDHLRIDTQLDFWDGIADALLDIGTCIKFGAILKKPGNISIRPAWFAMNMV